MDERSTGIILRTRHLTETSLIVLWLTPDQGRIATVAKGARRPKSPFRGKLDLFYAADFSFARSRRSELHNLREVSLRQTHPALRQDLGRLRAASYCAALIEQTTETETPLLEHYPLFQGLVEQLGQHASEPKTIFAFEMKLLDALGLSPDLTDSRLPPGTRQVLHNLTKSDWNALGALKLSSAQMGQIRRFLEGFLVFHLGRVPPSRSSALAGSD